MRSTDRFHVRIQLSHEGWIDWHCERNVLATFFKNGGLWIAIEIVGGEGYWWMAGTDSWVRYPLYENDSPNVIEDDKGCNDWDYQNYLAHPEEYWPSREGIDEF